MSGRRLLSFRLELGAPGERTREDLRTLRLLVLFIYSIIIIIIIISVRTSVPSPLLVFITRTYFTHIPSIILLSVIVMIVIIIIMTEHLLCHALTEHHSNHDNHDCHHDYYERAPAQRARPARAPASAAARYRAGGGRGRSLPPRAPRTAPRISRI